MRYALIDNSSLTGIQRLLGQIPVKNRAIIDNDIIALENYLQSILFYDSIICIDDYKQTYRKSRLDFFPDIKFISKNLFEYDSFVKEANKVTKDICLEIRGGKVADKDFKKYLDDLHLTFQFTWDMSSSKYFLTQKMLLGGTKLSKEHFDVLHALMFKENNEQYEVLSSFIDKPPKLFDSRGNQITYDTSSGKIITGFGEGFSPQFKALVASLNWISQRTAFYILVAEYLQADLFIQPLRQAFLQNIIRRIYPGYRLGVFNDFRSNINSKSEETIKNILSNSNNFDFSLDIPFFSAYFAGKTNDSRKIIEAAYEERDKPYFLEARTKLRELYRLIEDENKVKFVREINLLTNDINKNFESIKSKYGIGNEQGVGGKMRFMFSFIPYANNFKFLGEKQFRIEQLEPLKHIIPRRGFNAVYRNVIDEIIDFDCLGKYKDVLLRNVKFSPDCHYWGIKTEDINYVKAHSHWKAPM